MIGIFVKIWHFIYVDRHWMHELNKRNISLRTQLESANDELNRAQDLILVLKGQVEGKWEAKEMANIIRQNSHQSKIINLQGIQIDYYDEVIGTLRTQIEELTPKGSI